MPPITHAGICEQKTYGFFRFLWIASIIAELVVGHYGNDSSGYKLAGVLFGFGLFWIFVRKVTE